MRSMLICRHAFILWSWLLLFCLCAPAMAAHRQQHPDSAQDQEAKMAARVHLLAGVQHFNDGRYADAQREMEQAYKLRPEPEMLYNLAQCYQRLGDSQRALDALRGYLDGRPDAEDRIEVQKSIGELSKRLQ